MSRIRGTPKGVAGSDRAPASRSIPALEGIEIDKLHVGRGGYGETETAASKITFSLKKPAMRNQVERQQRQQFGYRRECLLPSACLYRPLSWRRLD